MRFSVRRLWSILAHAMASKSSSLSGGRCGFGGFLTTFRLGTSRLYARLGFYCFPPAAQFSTTVIGVESASSSGTMIRKRLPSAETA